MRLTVIIPTVNEEENLEATLHALGPCLAREDGAAGIIVADAGSNDATAAIAKKWGCTVLTDLEKGRAGQLNAAAEIATGDLLLFLHADTIISRESIVNLRETMETLSQIIGGGFYRKFDSPSLLLRFTCWLAGLRGRHWRIFLGDQAMFVRKAEFQRLGGFNESLVYGEDLDFSLRMRKRGKTAIIGPPVLSSARRFEKKGPARQTWIDLRLAIRLTRDAAGR